MQTRNMLGLGSEGKLPTVLLIDDDMVSREVAATVLTLSGYTVHTAADGASALEIVAAGRCTPDVILMDTQMPGLGGANLIGQLRQCTGAAVIAISGSEVPADVIRAADGFLMKPFDAEALEDVLRKRLLEPSSEAKCAADNSDPVVSAEKLAQFRRMMPDDAVREILVSVATDLDQRLTELEAAIARRDFVEVRRIGHVIKGGCGMAGAVQAARLGAELEELPADVPDNLMGNSARLLGNLRAAAQNLERILASGHPV